MLYLYKEISFPLVRCCKATERRGEVMYNEALMFGAVVFLLIAGIVNSLCGRAES